MKKLGLFAMLLSLCMFVSGCKDEKKPPEGGTKPAADTDKKDGDKTGAAADDKTGGDKAGGDKAGGAADDKAAGDKAGDKAGGAADDKAGGAAGDKKE